MGVNSKSRIEWAPNLSNVTIAIPELGVLVELDKGELIRLARKAHDNKSRKSTSGPCTAFITGARPDRFNDRYSVFHERAGGGGRTNRLWPDEAEKLFDERVRDKEVTYVELRGPKDAKARTIVVLKTHGTKKEK